MSTATFELDPIEFATIECWADDDHAEAFRCFVLSARRLVDRADAGMNPRPSDAMLAVCRTALELVSTSPSPPAHIARDFFERLFTPHRVRATPPGLLTGYYEPVLLASRTRSPEFPVPLLRRPPDLVNLVDESERGAVGTRLTHGRQTPLGVEPYATRTEIENGALDDQGLEIAWLSDPVDAFFLHVQGSGQLRFADGTSTRLAYAGKNGHPYTSVGRVVIDAGHMSAEEMSLDALKDWLRADPERGRDAMRHNASYIFFRELTAGDGDGALGVMEIPLTPMRSLAVDTAFHEIGLPVFISVDGIAHMPDGPSVRRLMIAQDVGSAIRGPERGDFYFGTGDEAGFRAGVTKHPLSFIVLKPNGTS
ncbi:MAG: MltA domain-containing protein [Hyphomicrobium sp.]|nr:MltA domain-containing protein [Hyphomicrobium sp.]